MEYLDILDEHGNPTGRAMEKGAAHRAGLWHRTAHVWIINRRGELLLQLRARTKRDYPNMWDISAAGHIVAGEEPMAGAMRELREELGEKAGIRDEDLRHICTLKHESTLNTGDANREFSDVYLVRTELPAEAFTFDDGEVARVEYMPWRELKRRIDEGDSSILPHPEEYALLFAELAAGEAFVDPKADIA
jgi:isopentenyldiphosphate isomerase